MTISAQTTADIKAIIETLSQRLHEMTFSKDAVNAAHAAEVAEQAQGMLEAA